MYTEFLLLRAFTCPLEQSYLPPVCRSVCLSVCLSDGDAWWPCACQPLPARASPTHDPFPAASSCTCLHGLALHGKSCSHMAILHHRRKRINAVAEHRRAQDFDVSGLALGVGLHLNLSGHATARERARGGQRRRRGGLKRLQRQLTGLQPWFNLHVPMPQ